MFLTFSDVVTRFGKGLSREELVEAYRRASRAFVEQLQQKFVLLREGQEPIAGDFKGSSSVTPR
jgi:hypothetical protein